MSLRTRRRSGKRHRWVIVPVILLAAALVVLLLAPMLVMNWVRGYLQQEAFRGRMEDFFGTKLDGAVTLAPLRWTGDEVTCPEARATTANGWTADIDGLHLGLDWNAFRDRQWRIVGAGADSLMLRREATTMPPASPKQAADGPAPLSGGSSIAVWLQRYLPVTTVVDGMQVDRFSLNHPGHWLLRDARLRLAAWRQGESSVQAVVDGGIIETPVQLPVQPQPLKFTLVRAAMRLSLDDLHLTETTLHWLGSSEITARGHLRPQDGSWNLSTQFTGVPLAECVDEDWRARLSGSLEGDVEITGKRASAPVVDGDVKIVGGVLTALPVLDQLAAYTQVERFKRLVLDIATAHVRISDAGQHFDKIVVQSNGLLRIEGSLSIRKGEIDGSFMVGVTPGTLRWIPGAQQHVFTVQNPAGPPGMVWTPLRITGTMDAPREDLSSRLVIGAGKAVLDAPGQVVDQGSRLLLSPVVGKDNAAKPGEIMKGATDAAGKAVDTGVKLLQGIGSGLLGK